MRRTPQERFWAKVKVTDSCWIWMGSKSPGGYGLFWDGEKRIQASHFLLDRRPVMPEQACHTCDNPPCVRPDHIFIGTQAANVKDMIDKGRLLISDGRYNTKLTEQQAMLIKACPKYRGALAKMIAALPIHQVTASRIRRGVEWKHLPPPTPADFARATEFLSTLPQ